MISLLGFTKDTTDADLKDYLMSMTNCDENAALSAVKAYIYEECPTSPAYRIGLMIARANSERSKR